MFPWLMVEEFNFSRLRWGLGISKKVQKERLKFLQCKWWCSILVARPTLTWSCRKNLSHSRLGRTNTLPRWVLIFLLWFPVLLDYSITDWDSCFKNNCFNCSQLSIVYLNSGSRPSLRHVHPKVDRKFEYSSTQRKGLHSERHQPLEHSSEQDLELSQKSKNAVEAFGQMRFNSPPPSPTWAFSSLQFRHTRECLLTSIAVIEIALAPAIYVAKLIAEHEESWKPIFMV